MQKIYDKLVKEPQGRQTPGEVHLQTLLVRPKNMYIHHFYPKHN